MLIESIVIFIILLGVFCVFLATKSRYAITVVPLLIPTGTNILAYLFSESISKLLPFDKMVTSYWGYGFNPPSIHFMVFSIITLFLLYALFSMLESVKWCSRVLSVLAFGGSNTLYIFMFHLLAKSVFVSIVPFVLKNVWIMRLTVFPAMIVLPVLGKVAMDVVCKKLKSVQ